MICIIRYEIYFLNILFNKYVRHARRDFARRSPQIYYYYIIIYNNILFNKYARHARRDFERRSLVEYLQKRVKGIYDSNLVIPVILCDNTCYCPCRLLSCTPQACRTVV